VRLVVGALRSHFTVVSISPSAFDVSLARLGLSLHQCPRSLSSIAQHTLAFVLRTRLLILLSHFQVPSLVQRPLLKGEGAGTSL